MNQIKSDGGSSKYYEICIPVSRLKFVDFLGNEDDNGEFVIVQVEDVIEYGLDNDFDKGNLFKVLYRFGSKAGNTLSYELNKMQYSLNKLKRRFLGESNE